jgi:hypothetical protein
MRHWIQYRTFFYFVAAGLQSYGLTIFVIEKKTEFNGANRWLSMYSSRLAHKSMMFEPNTQICSYLRRTPTLTTPRNGENGDSLVLAPVGYEKFSFHSSRGAGGCLVLLPPEFSYGASRRKTGGLFFFSNQG